MSSHRIPDPHLVPTNRGRSQNDQIWFFWESSENPQQRCPCLGPAHASPSTLTPRHTNYNTAFAIRSAADDNVPKDPRPRAV